MAETDETVAVEVLTFKECMRVAGPLLHKLFSNLADENPKVGFILVGFEIDTGATALVTNGTEPHLAIRALLDAIASFQEQDDAEQVRSH